MNYLIGYFSRRQFFHIIAYRDTQEEVDAFLKNHNKRGLVVYAVQHSAEPTVCLACGMGPHIEYHARDCEFNV